MKGRTQFTESSHGNERRVTHTDAQTGVREFRKLAVEMDSGGMIYTPGFMKISSGIQKSIGAFTDTQTYRCADIQKAWRLHTLTFIFFRMEKVG
jgi:hypothetical protein